MRLRLDGVTKTFGDARVPVHALADVSLDVAAGTCLVVLGPSGSGKTTLLRIVAGLERPDRGAVRFDERDVTREPPERRGAGVVFAEDALFPHMSVARNIGYAGVGVEAAREAARTMRVEHLFERRADTLSGGERQRVALARAFATAPALLLLDEPLSRLDAPLRAALRLELGGVLRERGYTTLLVTHDQVEALTLADNVAIVRSGAIEQFGTPRDVYERPVNRFVAGFVGTPGMSFVRAAAVVGVDEPAAAWFGIRVDAVTFAERGDFAGVVRVVDDFGADAFAYVETEHGTIATRVTGNRPAIGSRVGLAVMRARLHAFDANDVRVERAARG